MAEWLERRTHMIVSLQSAVRILGCFFREIERRIEEVLIKNGRMETTEGYSGVYKAPGEDRT